MTQNIQTRNFKNKVVHRFQHLPLGFLGLSLGIGGIGNCLTLLAGCHGYPSKWISCVSISIVILILLFMIGRFCMHPKILFAELNDNIGVSIIPTFSMSLFLLGGFVASFSKVMYSPAQIIGTIISLCALLIQIIVICFFMRMLIHKHIKTSSPAYGSYFVPTVGLIVSCTTVPNFVLLPALFFQIIWFVGFVFYIFSFPIVTYSMLFGKKVDDDKFPTSVVWFAPTNLIPAGFILAFLLNPHNSPAYPVAFLNVMFFLTSIFGAVFSIILYMYVLHVFIKNKFSPLYCAMSFPTAISATSMINSARYCYKSILDKDLTLNGDMSHDFIVSIFWFYAVFGIILTILSLGLITYILIRMLILWWQILFTNLKDHEFHPFYKLKHHPDKKSGNN